MTYIYLLGFAAALALSFIFTPLVKMFAFKVNAVDRPNHRKVHTRIMPRLGGLAIFAAFAGTYFILSPWLHLDKHNLNLIHGLLAGGTIIVIIGALDDRFELSAKVKLLGQIIAACVVVFGFGIKVNFYNVPFGDPMMPIQDWIAIPLTIFWIVGVTNAINLIDGLDGLAAGVSGIATATILVLALFMVNGGTVILISSLLLGSIIGFLFFNFHPAKIFMGDSGSLFLGFSLATLSIMGFKQATLVSFIIPLFIIGVPLSDTFFAIVRRWVNNKPIFAPDKGHLHHCLQQLGFSHRKTVLMIYGVALFFGTTAVVLSQVSQIANWVTVLVIAATIVVLQLGAEVIGIVDRSRRPLLSVLQRLRMKTETDTNSK
ncbi:hypothetical protein SY83_10875 [Paenibacillus swuensis]|uniref:UDP-phosphate N-acetylglucosaminyl 1-phosphate transferase n=1 Tax=Paenibacillus swuensis TaxID=1178515 RepID=A0A172TI25_9BACL|nr:MraY family glycosyltransferase [Paenibacillus swuensis]ANE46691.1 hypothetical protein SY83_10875 [Paenibacillus swuensis]